MSWGVYPRGNIAETDAVDTDRLGFEVFTEGAIVAGYKNGTAGDCEDRPRG